ncbi:hypothetical protein AC578_5759 [Pseudocercospora eumusae]|uniref:RBR-type E3 ubiquitin transferase n=1 Tax=Pseudocercospora eumusae TaxID=321146 RepID=A0A139H546_9PEZI|nr:hypothetical protein AC578_5759 [Pseudocercospora eumusae]
MAIGSLSGRSTHARRSTRPHRSLASTRHKSSVKADGGEPAAAKPDVEELRKKRLGYYSVPSSERRRVSSISSAKAKARAPSRSTTSTVKAADSEHKRRTRKRGSSSDKATRKASADQAQSAGFVYAASTEEHGAEQEERWQSQSSLDKTSKRSSSSRQRHLPVVVEDELRPEDSISQVGLPQIIERRKSSRSSRTSLKRSTTTPAKLATITEAEGDPKASPASPRRATKRDSTPSLLAIWRRNSVVSVPPPRLVDCLTCGSDDVPAIRSAKLACGHRMCHDCLKRVFEMSVKDPAHMPPKCCTNDHIPLKHVDNLFDLKFKTLWNRKYQEYHTKNRIYCTNSKCGEWIKPKHFHTSSGRKYAQCPCCATKVCTLCNGKMHKSRHCPKDPEIAQLMEQAKEKGWQTCYSCHAMVELKEGCNHMTCRCTAEFCMICGSKWKTCDCPWFNYTQLPDADRLMHMRVPEPILPVLERVMGAAGMPLPPRPANARAPRQDRRERLTYQDELDQRRRQERLDEDLARRLQLASLFDHDDEPPDRHRMADVRVWGVEHEGGHFMNDNFVQNAANVVMSAFGDAAMGRRGERASGRRRRPRPEQSPQGDDGLAPNFLGDESVVGAGRR